MTLPRTDCLISFAGETDYAYPLMLQMARAIEFYPASFDRRVDITAVKGHTIRLFNQMRGLIHDLPGKETTPGDPRTGFLFGGYSWREQQFGIWKLQYQQQIDAYTFHRMKAWRGQREAKMIAMTGDETLEAHRRLIELLRIRGKLSTGGFDMEPFEVLRDMIRAPEYNTIGGAPQVAKVYRYLQTQHFAVHWPTSEGAPHALGRPALPYERFEAPVIDPDNPGHESRAGSAEADQPAIDASFLMDRSSDRVT